MRVNDKTSKFDVDGEKMRPKNIALWNALGGATRAAYWVDTFEVHPD